MGEAGQRKGLSDGVAKISGGNGVPNLLLRAEVDAARPEQRVLDLDD
jgi:hypothetical protein